MKILFGVLSIFLLLSIAGNVYFLIGDGIKIYNDNKVTQHTHQNQQQAQIQMNFWMTKGHSLYKSYKFTTPEIRTSFMNTLSPEKAILSKYYPCVDVREFCVDVFEIIENKK